MEANMVTLCCKKNLLFSCLMGLAVAFTASAQTNLALNKTVTASSYQSGNTPGKAVDGSTTTRWCANNGANGAWLKVDLGSTCNLTSTQVMWEANAVYKYKIEGSTDNSNWVTLANRTSNTTSAQTFTDNFTASRRYIRITATTLPSGRWASIYEFRVFGYPNVGLLKQSMDVITESEVNIGPVQGMQASTETNALFFGGKACLATCNAGAGKEIGSYITVNSATLPIGTYDITIYFKKASSLGKCTFSISDGNNNVTSLKVDGSQNGDLDQYNSTTVYRAAAKLRKADGTFYQNAAPGTLKLKMTVSGKSGSGYNLSIDRISFYLISPNIVAGVTHAFYLKSGYINGCLDGYAAGSNGCYELSTDNMYNTPTNKYVPTQIFSCPACHGRKQFTAIAAGNESSMIINNDNKHLCLWGRNYNGECGMSLDNNQNLVHYDIINHPTPLMDANKNPIMGIDKIINFSGTTIFTKNDGTAWGLGSNWQKQIGPNNNPADIYYPIQMFKDANGSQGAALTNVIKIANGGSRSFYITSDYKLWGTGGNWYGELGIDPSSFTGGGRVVQINPAVWTQPDIWDIACGTSHTIFLKTDGTVWTSGANFNGELGTTPTGGGTHMPTQILAGTAINSIAAGFNFSVFLLQNGTVYACGVNDRGQLGNGTTSSSSTPMQILTSAAQPITGIVSIAANPNGQYVLMLKNDGSYWACGANEEGQLGINSTLDQLYAVNVPVP